MGQLQVNSAYPLVLLIGLSLIGIPNAILWAILTLLLRFLPYVGLWISAFFPLILSFAISTDWKAPLFTFSLYGFLEVFTNNFVESIKTIGRMIRAIRLASPKSVISVCLWSLPREGAARWIRRINESADAVYTDFEEAARNLTAAKETAAVSESD
jgi:hypothetical protein